MRDGPWARDAAGGPGTTICLSALGGDLSVLALRQIHIPHHIAAIYEVVFDIYGVRS